MSRLGGEGGNALSCDVLSFSGWGGAMARFGGISFGSDQEMSRWNFENGMQISGLGLPALPWETGIFSQIFVPGQTPETLRLPAIYPPGEPFVGVESDEEEAAEIPASAIPVFARCVQALSDQDYECGKSLIWTRALACWTGIIEGSRFESLVGKHVFELLCIDDRKGATGIIRDVCGIRSPKTALKRAQGLMQLIRFCKREKSPWWPLTERTVLRYIGWNEGNEKSKLIGKNLIAALKFFKYVMGADFNLEAVLSPLVTGRVSRIVGDREPRVQARPLTLEELQILENKVYDLPNVVERYMVGCILYAVYARCRWSDLHSVHSIEFDVIDTKDGKFGFVEVRSRAHKTGGTEEKKVLFMPFVAPVAGVTTRPWAMAWKEAMEALGFCLWRRPYGAICRAPSASGSFGVRPVTTSEITNMLNGFLGHKVGSPLRTTSHSMKDTLLAWSARYGIEENARTLLGHHSLQGSSMACYSRDLMTGPTRQLSAMILNIRLGDFLPDATRSGWMSSKQVPLEVIPTGADLAEGRIESEVDGLELETAGYTPSFEGPDGDSMPHSPGSLKSFELVENEAKGEVGGLGLEIEANQGETAATRWLSSLEVFGDTEDIPRSPAEEFIAGAGAWMGEDPAQSYEEVVESASSAEEPSSDDGDATDEEGFQEEQGFIGTSNIKRVRATFCSARRPGFCIAWMSRSPQSSKGSMWPHVELPVRAFVIFRGEPTSNGLCVKSAIRRSTRSIASSRRKKQPRGVRRLSKESNAN